MVGGVGGYASRRVELAGPDTQASPLGDEGARRSELLDPVVGEIGHDDVAREAGRHTEFGSDANLADSDASTSPPSYERRRGVHLQHQVEASRCDRSAAR